MTSNTQKKRRVGRPKESNNKDRRARLVEAAGPIFSTKGYGGTKIPDLANGVKRVLSPQMLARKVYLG